MTSTSTLSDCVFCAIVAGEIPARIVFESSTILAFLDANPLAPGHTLVIPREHYETLESTPSEIRDTVLQAMGQLAPAVVAAVDADGSNVGFNDGPAAGQEVPHLHGHIIPRFDNDGGNPIHAVAGRSPALDQHELETIAEKIEAVSSSIST